MTDSHQENRPGPRRIVAIDCATLPASVAVVGSDGESCVTVHRDEQRTDAWIGAAIEECLAACDTDLQTIAGFAACVGPGTFTGIRVGIATALGLAAPRGLPVCGVRSLDALALLGTDKGSRRVVACIDARREQVYAAIYKRGADTGGPLLEPIWGPRVCAAQEVLQRLGELEEPPLIIGSGGAYLAATDAESAGGKSEPVFELSAPPPPLAEAVGRLALRGWPDQLDAPPAWPPPHPVYVRPPDARPPRNPLLEARHGRTFEQP